MLSIMDITSRKLDASVYGGKAQGLSLLYQMGMNVPQAFAIEAVNNTYNIDEEFCIALKQKLAVFEQNGCYRVAVRSSATLEDSYTENLAGRFLTVLGEMHFEEIIDSIKRVIESLSTVNSEQNKMGIIIQRMLDSDFAGVIYSSDPHTYSKSSMLISYIEGTGEKLVSGEVAGHDLKVSLKNNEINIDGKNKIQDLLIRSLCQSTKQVEEQLCYPIDVEWAIKNNELYYLQCRPLTSITKIHTRLCELSQFDDRILPQAVNIGNKFHFWKKATAVGINMPPIYIFLHNHSSSTDKKAFNFHKSDYCKGYSAIGMYPDDFSANLTKFFLGDKKRVFGNVSRCCRYGIRSFPTYDNLDKFLELYNQETMEKSWISVTVLQEMYEPIYSGIIQPDGDKYLIELTKGNLLTKGSTPVSRYVLNDNRVIHRQETQQNMWYQAIEGHIVCCICNENDDLAVTLSDKDLCFLLYYFKAILEDHPYYIEFGILEGKEKAIQPFLMDAVNHGTYKNISSGDALSGILSGGSIKGKIVYVTDSNFEEVMRKHWREPVVFFCQRPDISLLPLLDLHTTGQIGFVFEEGSVLCHMASTLREKAIPALLLQNQHKRDYPEGRVCVINANLTKSGNEKRLYLETNP